MNLVTWAHRWGFEDKEQCWPLLQLAPVLSVGVGGLHHIEKGGISFFTDLLLKLAQALNSKMTFTIRIELRKEPLLIWGPQLHSLWGGPLSKWTAIDAQQCTKYGHSVAFAIHCSTNLLHYAHRLCWCSSWQCQDWDMIKSNYSCPNSTNYKSKQTDHIVYTKQSLDLNVSASTVVLITTDQREQVQEDCRSWQWNWQGSIFLQCSGSPQQDTLAPVSHLLPRFLVTNGSSWLDTTANKSWYI